MSTEAPVALAAGVRVFGIRHHGPGSARSLVQALHGYDPTIVLIEGPPEADGILPLAVEAGMSPPVALLVYDEASPSDAVFYPFAVFSPEWQAIRWALDRQRPVRFIDLPFGVELASRRAEEEAAKKDESKAESKAASSEHAEANGIVESQSTDSVDNEETRDDPIGDLARAAGCEDREPWWEHVIEQRQDPNNVFAAVIEAMRGVRSETTPPREALREAHMRRAIRQARKDGHERVAVVCGAWHAPALDEMPTAKHDDALLKGLPKSKLAAAWIPWTHSRLGYRSGYGAGVDSPGWYAHLWNHGPNIAERWISKAARLLREEGLDAPVAGVIEAVRLAEALAAMRDVPAPGLAELRESILTVLCHGEKLRLEVIRRQLEVGTDLGSVPESAPQVPLARDLAALQKRLRMPPTAEPKQLDLDLRKDYDRERSKLLHRMGLLGIGWGKEAQASQANRGTFREAWQIAWDPELAVKLIECAAHGNTIEVAATNYAISRGAVCESMGELATLVDQTLLAELPMAAVAVLAHLQSRSALSSDITGLLAALPPLARAAKYGSVRQAPTEHILALFATLAERAIAGLPTATTRLNAEAAQELRPMLLAADEAVARVGNSGLVEGWREVLRTMVSKSAVTALIRGTSLLLLVRCSAATDEEIATALGRELSPGEPHELAAAWLEGFVDSSAAVLVHRTDVLPLVDRWLLGLPEAAFVESLPLLRRAFGSFDAGEIAALTRRVMGLPAPSDFSRPVPGGIGTPKLPATSKPQATPNTRPSILAAMGRIMGVTFK